MLYWALPLQCAEWSLRTWMVSVRYLRNQALDLPIWKCWMYTLKSSDVLRSSRFTIPQVSFPNLALKWTEHKKLYFFAEHGYEFISGLCNPLACFTEHCIWHAASDCKTNNKLTCKKCEALARDRFLKESVGSKILFWFLSPAREERCISPPCF